MPIRILQIVSSLNKGSGINNVIFNWHKNIDREKIQFDYLYFLDAPVSFEKEIKELGGQTYKLPCPSISCFYFFIKSVINFFKIHKYKTIHSHITHLNFFYFPIAKFYGVKNIIFHAHVTKYSDHFLNGIRNRLMTGLVKSFIKYKFACSDAAGKFWHKKNYTVVNNGIDVARFKYNPDMRNKKRQELNVENKFVISNIGRFEKQKNHIFLIDVFKEIYKTNKNAVLILAGNGSMLQKIKEKVQKLNLSRAVNFLGVTKDIPSILQATDVLVMPSFYEGLPVIGIEAQASGVPCVFSDAITKEVMLLPQSRMISLNDGAEKWADEILEYDQFKREDVSGIIKQAGFDMKDIMLKVQEFYLKL